ncbi:MAG: efflux RND transporter periplasmic adaptor subunit [bacterium]
MRFLAALMILLAACERGPADAHDDHGHSHGEDTHEASEETLKWTHVGPVSQIYAEWAPARVGQRTEILIHLTDTGTWRPITADLRVDWVTDGQAQAAPVERVQPGIYRALVTPNAAGEARIDVRFGDVRHSRQIHVSSPTDEPGHGHGEDDHGHHEHADEDGEQAGGIAFSLEQQWVSDFRLAEVEEREVRPSFEAYGTLRPRMGGVGVVNATTAGRVFAETMPKLGQRVSRGDTLAWLVPALSDQGDFASLDFAVSDSQVRVRQAESEVKRLEGLVRDGVVPARRLTDAQFTLEQARASLNAANQRSRQAKGVSTSGRKAAGSIPLTAPIDGIIVAIDVPAGLFVESGQSLFQIVDPDPIWLVVDVPEAHVSRLGDVTGVWFTVEGFEQTFEPTNQEVATGGMLDSHSRTLPLVVTVNNPDGALKPGMFANVNVVDGPSRKTLAIPATAVVIENGVHVAYVMKTGESFERRAIEVGTRDGDFVEIKSGVQKHEFVVTQGAYTVRLASLGDQEVGHGHAH